MQLMQMWAGTQYDNYSFVASNFAHFSYCPLIQLCKQSGACSSLAVQSSDEVSPPFALAQHGRMAVLSSLQTYALEVMPPSPRLCESGLVTWDAILA